MPPVIEGIIHGKMIELMADPGLAEGQRVEITIRPVGDPQARIDAIMRTAGAMANDPEFEAAMAVVERERNAARFRESEE